MALIVVGLAVTAPPSCVCVPGDHLGALLHPIFPHVHASGQDAWADNAPYPLASHEVATYDSAPGVSAPLSDAPARDVMSGMLLPLILSAMLLEMARPRPLAAPAPAERSVSPLTPPPRLTLARA